MNNSYGDFEINVIIASITDELETSIEKMNLKKEDKLIVKIPFDIRHDEINTLYKVLENKFEQDIIFMNNKINLESMNLQTLINLRSNIDKIINKSY